MTSFSNKSIWNIAYPIVFGNLAQTLIVLIDTAFLGRVSPIALGAAMMAGLYYYVFSTLAWGFSIGVQIIIARRLGEGLLHRVGVVFQHGVLFVALLSATLFFFLHNYSDYILTSIIQSPNILDAASEFMNYRHYGIIFVCFNFLFRALYIGLSNTKVIIYSTFLMAAVNIGMDYALIFGKWIFPEMGIGGAALASVLAEVSALIFFIIYSAAKLPLKSYGLNAVHKFGGWLMKATLKLAFPTMLQKLLSFGMWFIFFVMVEHMGEIPIAISGIIRSAYMLISIPAFAFGVTVNTLTSRIIGTKDLQQVMPTVYKTLKLSLVAITPILLLCVFFPVSILSIYTDDIALLHTAVPSLYVVCIATIAMTLGMTFFEAVSGTGNTIHALGIEVAVLILYAFAVWFFASVIGTHVELVWCSEIIYGLTLAGCSWLYMKYAQWQKKKI